VGGEPAVAIVALHDWLIRLDAKKQAENQRKYVNPFAHYFAKISLLIPATNYFSFLG
jgi:hypothetical protein